MEKLIVKPDNDVFIEFEGERRRIGSFQDNVMWHDGTIKNNVFCCTRSSDRHFMKKYYGFGFNYDLIMSEMLDYQYIMMTTDKVKHFLERDFVAKHGIFDDSIRGFEPQLFIPSHQMVQIRRNKYQEMKENHGTN